MMDPNQQHNPCVLPSNAPPHYDVVPSYPELGGASRVLQEGCGNRQQDGYVDSHQQYQLASTKLGSYRENAENVYRPVAGHVQYRHHRPVRPYCNEEESKRREIEKLWKRLNSCHLYRKYRARQPTKLPNDGEQKWPDAMERAFWAALVEHPPMGRRKESNLGRNELVADYVQKLTGESRTRKQVSSHIQVMKPMVKDDPYILQYLSMGDDRRTRHRAHAGMSRMRHSISGIHPRNFHHPQPNRLPSQMHDSFLPQASKYERDPDSRGSDGSYYPVLFEMRVANMAREPPASIHKFTALGAEPRRPDCNLNDERSWSWRESFPPLATVHDEGVLAARVIFCHARLELLPQQIPQNAVLEIMLDIDTPEYVASSDGLHSTTSFFNNGALIDRRDEPVMVVTEDLSRCRVKFSAAYWATVITGWQKALRAADAGQRAEAEFEVQASLARLSATQEITYRSPHTGESQLLLLLCWKFEFAKGHGTTTWQNVRYRDEQSSIAVEEDAKDDLLKTPVQQVTTGFSQLMVPMPGSFDHGNFDFGDLGDVAMPGLTPDLDPAVVGAEAFSANDIDFHGGNIQVCMDSNLPIQAYAEASQSFEDYSRASSIAMGGDWVAQYPNVFYDGHYDPGAFEQVGPELGKEDGLLGSQQFILSPVAHMRTEAGAVQRP